MELKRFFVDKNNLINNKVYLNDVEHNHLSNVLRLSVGDNVLIVCGDGFDYTCSIESITKKQTILNVLSKSENIYDPKVNVTIYQAIIKGDNMPLVVQKLNELGISTLTPITTKYTVALGSKNLVNKLQNTANQSVKQCKRSKPLFIDDIKSIKDIVKEFCNYDLVLVPYEKENSVTMQNAIIGNLKAKNIACIVGSEGGFSEEEIEFLCEHGAKAITLGNRILRAETASIAISSVLMYAFGEWDKWKLF